MTKVFSFSPTQVYWLNLLHCLEMDVNTDYFPQRLHYLAMFPPAFTWHMF